MMTRCTQLILLLCLLIFTPSLAWSAQGTVIHAQGTCEYFIVQVYQEYFVVGYDRGPRLKLNDQIEGYIRQSGIGIVKVGESESKTKIYSYAHSTSEKEALERLAHFCHR